MPDERKFTVDFYVVSKAADQATTAFADLLDQHKGGHAPAYELEPASKEKYQIRSISATKNGNIFMAVFGRCRYGETPEQTAEDGDESDVDLKPGHGLVEKNHFLFYRDLNLVVYQRNSSGSTASKLQRYLNRPAYAEINLDPVLTGNSYERLALGGGLKKIELSIAKPQLTPVEGEEFIQEAIEMFGKAKAGRMKVVLSAERNKGLAETMRMPVATLAKLARTKVARVHMEAENDGVEVVDLIGDRIRETATVALEANGRPTAHNVYAALAEAKDRRNDDLYAFFG